MIYTPRRTDDNHAEILSALRCTGAYVIDCSHVGRGFPDALLIRHGKVTMVEIKDGAKPKSKRKLTASQMVLHAETERNGVIVQIVKNEAEALALIGERIAV
jgi:soluble P-type ATPase